MTEKYIEQIRTGKVKHLGREGAEDRLDRPWSTGMFKKKQEGQLWLTKTGLKTDEIGDLKTHGGEEKALFAYTKSHYDYWHDQVEAEINVGGMGENLVIIGVNEGDICIGDSYQIGDALIQVSQPRQPCWKPARRYRTMDLALKIQKSGRTGWYYRVLEEGHISGNSTAKLLERPYPEWTIAACNEVMHEKRKDMTLAYELANCSLLAPNWKRRLNKRIKGRESKIEKRVYGPNKEEE